MLVDKEKFKELLLGGEVTYMVAFSQLPETIDLCSTIEVTDFISEVLEDPEKILVIPAHEASPLWKNLINGDVPIYQVRRKDGLIIEIYIQHEKG